MRTIILEKVKTTEKIVKQIEADNILVFQVDRALTKPEIKAEIEKLFDVKVDSVRTYTHKNKKNVYAKLNKDFPAIDVATKLGIM